MSLIFTSLFLLFGGAFLSLILKRKVLLGKSIATLSVVAASLFGLIAVYQVLFLNKSFALTLPWSLPLGSFHIAFDSLSAFFALALFILAPLSSLFCFATIDTKKAYWVNASFNLLIASLFLVFLARDGLLFLMAWELMVLTSFFLVMTEHEKPGIGYEGWVYLIATHISGFALFTLFFLLGSASNSLNFDSFGTTELTLAFVLALIGFGTKAGFIPLHLWLGAEAHPATPSFVSAMMSGIMINTGIYGLLRTLIYLGSPMESWGWTLIVLGAISGIFGILFASTEKDIKRQLAYSSVENIGIILLGIGTSIVGYAKDLPLVATFGLAAALLHVLNHAIYKGLLFLGSGAIYKITQTTNMDKLGGLLKRAPLVGYTFLIGSIAIIALPPFNGFISEFLLFMGALHGTLDSSLLGLLVIGSMAFISGYALLTFTRSFGILFLGEAREKIPNEKCAFGWKIYLPLLLLSTMTLGIGVMGPYIAKRLLNLVATALGFHESAYFSSIQADLKTIILLSLLFSALIGLLVLLRKRALKNRSEEKGLSWDCGYIAPTPRMQYTALSFTEPVRTFYRALLRTKSSWLPSNAIFPTSANFKTSCSDISEEFLFRPLFRFLPHLLGKMRWLQSGSLQLYILYIALTLFLLLIWKM